MTVDQLTIEEYVHNSSVLAAGLSRQGFNDTAYISLIRDNSKIPLIMKALEHGNRAAIQLLNLNMSLVHNVLAIQAPAYTGMPLRRYANTQQPYGTFDLIEKVIADLSQYQHFETSVFLQLLHENKFIVDSNGMPHIQFWIDDLVVFEIDDQDELTRIKYEKFSRIIKSSFSDDFIPKQLMKLSEDIRQGHYTTCLEMLNALRVARQSYFDSDSERKGEVIIKKVWGRMQKSMLLIVLVLLVLVYGLYWYYYSKPAISSTVYKTKIGDVAFVIEPEVGSKEIQSETYILIFPEEPADIIESEPISSDSSDTEPELEKSETIIIKPGDNLFRISLEYYGDGNYFTALAKYNNIQNPDLIPVGIALEIPPLQVLLEDN